MPDIKLPSRGEKPYDTRLNAAIMEINQEVDRTAAELSGRLSEQALNATIAGAVTEVVSGFSVADPRLASFKSALDGGRSAAVWFTGDSTVDWNGATDPTTRLAQNIAAAYPGHHVRIVKRQDGADLLDAPTVVQAASGRRHAIFAGTRGMRWEGTRPIVNSFDLRMLIAPDAWTPAANRTLFASQLGLTAGLQFEFRQKTSGVLSLRVSTNGTSFSSDRDSSVAVTGTDGQFTWVRVTFLMDGSNIVTTFYTSTDGVTWMELGTPHSAGSAATALAAADPAGYYSIGALGWQPAASAFSGKIAEVHISDSIGGAPHAPVLPELWERYPEAGNTFGGSPTVTIINMGRSSQDMAYHANPARLAFETTNYGQSVLIFSDSHNEGGKSGKVGWTDPYQAWVDAVRTRLPDAAVAVVKQNPHTPAWANEAAYGVSHQQRLDELGALAARNGWSIIDLFAAFKNDPRGLGALISSDGLHPTTLGYQFSGDEYARALGVPVPA